MLREGYRAVRIKEQPGIRKGHPLYGVDVLVEIYGTEVRVQCRAWEHGFEAAYTALANADVACVKMNGRPRLYIMTEEVWLAHLDSFRLKAA